MEKDNEKEIEQEVNNESDNQESQEKNDDFDSAKFTETSTDNKEKTDEEKTDKDEDGDDVWSFDKDDDDDDEGADEKDKDNSEKDKADVQKDDSSDADDDSSDKDGDGNEEDRIGEFEIKSITKEQFESFAEEIGITVKTPEEFVKAIKEIEKENNELKDKLEKSSTGNVENEVVSKLKKLQGKSDEELIRMDLKKQGFSDDEIEESVDTYIDSNLLKIEAKKIRNTIDRVINNEIKKTQEEAQKSEAMRKKEAEESVKALSEHIKGTDTMFGFKIAKDDVSLAKVQKKHIEYITSGNFLGDISKDEKSVTEAAWLWKNKDTLFAALKNSGSQKAKEEILNDLSNPEVSGTKRIKGPNSDDGFDPRKFVYGN